MAFLKTNHISNVNWSITDKAEGAAALVPGASATGGWAEAQLTASGVHVRTIVRNWPALDAGGWPRRRLRMSTIADRGAAGQAVIAAAQEP